VAIFIAQKEGIEWLCSRTHYVPGPSFKAFEARDKEGAIQGAVGMDFWMGKSAQLHVAFRNARYAPSLIGAILRYGFQENGFNALLAFFSVAHKNTLRFVRRLGFQEAGCIKGGGPLGFDLLIMELRPENCLARWRQKERRAA
jgi:RimJ/RimL family protein N-acetyltransferase